MANPVIHFEVAGPDALGLQAFYASLFDWKINADNPMGYGMVEAAQNGIAGGVGPSPDGNSHITWYVEVDNLQAALDQAEKLGGKTVMPPMDVPGGPVDRTVHRPGGQRRGSGQGHVSARIT